MFAIKPQNETLITLRKNYEHPMWCPFYIWLLMGNFQFNDMLILVTSDFRLSGELNNYSSHSICCHLSYYVECWSESPNWYLEWHRDFDFERRKWKRSIMFMDPPYAWPELKIPSSHKFPWIENVRILLHAKYVWLLIQNQFVSGIFHSTHYRACAPRSVASFRDIWMKNGSGNNSWASEKIHT